MTSLRAISLGSCCLLLVCFCLRAIAFSIPAYKQCQQQLRPNHYRQHSTLCAKQPRYLEVNGSVKYGQLYRTIATVLASFCLAGQHPMPSTASDNPTVNYSKPPKAIRPLAYSVEMLDPPEMQPRSHTKGEENLLRKFATATDVLLFGNHLSTAKDSQLDQKLLTGILAKAQNKRQAVLLFDRLPNDQDVSSALDMFNKAKQSGQGKEATIDALINTLQALKLEPDFLTNYLKPLLDTTYPYPNIIIEAAGLPSAISKFVQEGGLEILSSDEKASLGINEDGFLKMISMPGFIAYNEDVLVGQFLDQALLASLAKSPADNVASEQIQSQLKHFVSWKLLQHEYVANRLAGAVPGTKASNNNLVIGVCDAEDVKFGYGIEERVKRILTTKAETLQAPRPSVYSLMTNPTAKDSLSYTAQLRLSLAYEDKLPDMRPLADYIWFSEYPEIKLLTNMQNPIDAEGQRPAGESSIFGVF